MDAPSRKVAPLRSMERLNKVSSLWLGITGEGEPRRGAPAEPRFFTFVPERVFSLRRYFSFSLFPFRVAGGHELRDLQT